MAGAVHQRLQLGLVPGVLAGAAAARLAGHRAGGVQALLERLFKLPRLGHGSRIFWGDLHRLSGVWSIWFIATISITGTWFLIQATLADNHVTISSEPIVPAIAREDVPRTADGQAPTPISLDEAERAATERFPGFEVTFITLPGNAYSHYYMGGRGWYPLMFETVNVNPYNSKVEASFMVSDRSARSSSPSPCARFTPVISAVSGSS